MAVDPQATPRASGHQYQENSHVLDQSRASSRQTNREYDDTAMSVNRIISRHRQHPSIASIMSDIESNSGSLRSRECSAEPPSISDVGENTDNDFEGLSSGYEANFNDRSSTPATATSSTHPTPPFSGGAFVYTRAVNASSPSPRTPISYQDDFGMKDMMAVIKTRAREYRRPLVKPKLKETRMRSSLAEASSRSDERPEANWQDDESIDEVDRHFIGEKIDWDEVHPEIKRCFQGVQERLDKFDGELDELLAEVGTLGSS